MKKHIGILFIALVASGIFAFRTADPVSIAIGTKAPKATLKMKDISGKEISLNDAKKEKGLLVIFSCNTCPFVVGAEGQGEGWEGRYKELKKTCDAQGIGMVLVNSNEAKRDKGDAMADMVSRAKEKGFENVMYTLDKNAELANAFGAKTTPHVFLFDKDLALVYKGAIDDSNESPAKVKESWLKNALENLGKGKTINPAETRPMGCSIKRV